MYDVQWRTELLRKYRWLTFLLPLLVFMLVGSLEPTPAQPGGGTIGLAIPYSFYPWLYSAKIALTVAAIVFVWPGYREFFPSRPSPAGRGAGGEGGRWLNSLAIVIGIVGGPLWIGLCLLNWEQTYLLPLLQRIGLGDLLGASARPAFNPFDQLSGQPVLAWTFLALRLFGLVAVVPLVEEFFLRGFLMRFVMRPDWWNVPFGKANALAVVLGTAAPMLMHPGELLAAAVWFSMITWLMLRTRNIWDCVAAHAITNLILGMYVVLSGDWRLM